MRTLAIETSSALCSVALFEDAVIASDCAAVGRGHAERLLPMVAALPGGGRADRVLVGCGPGSFTGIRVGIAAARALGFAWGIGVAGYSSLDLIAASWFARNDGRDVTVAIQGGHGEMFVKQFARGMHDTAPFRAMPLSDVAALTGPIAGDVIGDVIMPNAAEVCLLDGPAIDAKPLYGRAPDAKPMAA